jgi:hypothetical protein
MTTAAAKRKSSVKNKVPTRKPMPPKGGAARPAPRTPAQYLAAIPDEARRADMEALHRLIRKTLPDLAPDLNMGMIGYGTYHYRYATGREGDCSIIGLSSRAQYISLYVMGVEGGRFVAESYRSKLPKADIGKVCVRFKRLADVDLEIVAQMIVAGARAVARSTRAGATASQ